MSIWSRAMTLNRSGERSDRRAGAIAQCDESGKLEGSIIRTLENELRYVAHVE